MRGNRPYRVAVAAGCRSIPAYAGEPDAAGGAGFGAAVYPRVCGGTCAISTGCANLIGLSPRMRGNLKRIWGNFVRYRSIPAYAGEPRTAACAAAVRSVYPRVCGGTPDETVREIINAGLSPRMRGNPQADAERQVQAGSIPAYAGEPVAPPARAPGLPVYPRVCGGTLTLTGKAAGVFGLSPRMRGNRPARWGKPARPGSIPAYAGEPSIGACCCGACWVYPRVCGGTRLPRAPTLPRRGLSPRMRGNHP